MSVKIGHASISETGGINGAKGDSTGKEVCIRDWYDKGWDFMAIHPDAAVREKHAVAIEDACNNDYIGYGQNDRNTAYTQYKAAGSIKAIKTKCNTDCSALQNLAALVSGAPGVTYGSNGWTTSTMKAALVKAGYKIITDKTMLSSAEYCVRGAIYVKAGSHTVAGLTNGSKASQALAKAGITTATAAATATASKTQTAAASTTKVENAKSFNKSLAGTYKTTTGLNMRAGAGTSKKIITTLAAGTKVQCYGYYTDVDGVRWLYVTSGKLTGFCSSKYLSK
jgi:hypothetical protein